MADAARALKAWWRSEPAQDSPLGIWLAERDRAEAFRRRKELASLTTLGPLDLADPVVDGGGGVSA